MENSSFALLYEPQKEMRNILNFYLESQYTSRLISTHCVENFEHTLVQQGAQENITLISIEELTTAEKKILKHLANPTSKIPFILLANDISQLAVFKQIPQCKKLIQKPQFLEALNQVLPEFLKPAIETQGYRTKFFPINIEILTRLKNSEMDFFRKITDGAYIRAWSKDQAFKKKDAQELNEIQINELYVTAMESRQLCETLTDQLLTARKAICKSLDSGIHLSYETISAIKSIYNELGLTQENRQLIEAQVNLSLESLKQAPKIFELIENKMAYPGDYLQGHSTLLAFIAPVIGQIIAPKNSALHADLCQCAVLHDLSVESESLAQIQELDGIQLLTEHLEDWELKNYKTHQRVIVDAIKDSSTGQKPSDELIKMILLHHIHPDGNGFPDQYSQKDHTLGSALFYFAHQIIFDYYQNPKKWTIKQFLENHSNRFLHGHFRMILSTVQARL